MQSGGKGWMGARQGGAKQRGNREGWMEGGCDGRPAAAAAACQGLLAAWKDSRRCKCCPWRRAALLLVVPTRAGKLQWQLRLLVRPIKTMTTEMPPVAPARLGCKRKGFFSGLAVYQLVLSLWQRSFGARGHLAVQVRQPNQCMSLALAWACARLALANATA